MGEKRVPIRATLRPILPVSSNKVTRIESVSQAHMRPSFSRRAVQARIEGNREALDLEVIISAHTNLDPEG